LIWVQIYTIFLNQQTICVKKSNLPGYLATKTLRKAARFFYFGRFLSFFWEVSGIVRIFANKEQLKPIIII